MWLGHDLSWWSLIIALAALILAIPLTILGNIITPFLLNWWSGRSAASLVLRIAKLEDKLSSYETLPPLDESMALLLKAASDLIYLALVIYILVASVYCEAILLRKPDNLLGVQDVTEVLLAMIAVIVFISLLGKKILGRLDKYRIPRSPYVRDDLKKNIEKLSAKLSKAKV